ncbi:MAG TPA: thioredoxin family protein [Candidatus Dormibacteraeota bacterium]|nr:thioredoxin family protein [Candidatus Dormibacteraeota bacterium]
MSAQLWALAAVSVVVLAVAGLEAFRSSRARRLAARATGSPAAEPYIVYFTGESCTVCKTHQEPALARLGDVRIDRIDAVAERGLAERFYVYTLPTTVVMASDGRVLHVNYGYAPARKLEHQLAEARRGNLVSAAI